MNRKLIFLDIDGTLIANLSSPTPRVRRAVREARAAGHLVFLCTGRNLPIIGPDILEVGFDGIVASAGACVIAGNQVLFDRLLPEELVQECLSVFHSHGVFCRIETTDGIYTDPQMEALLRDASPDPRNSELIRMQKEIQSDLPIRAYAEYPRKGAYKLCFTTSAVNSIPEVQQILGDRFDFVVFPYGDSTCCFNGEITRKGISKGAGIDRICRYFEADSRDVIAFGDSMNDVSMFEHAALRVAMGNACEELKAMADLICEDVSQDGVYLAFRRLGLCK